MAREGLVAFAFTFALEELAFDLFFFTPFPFIKTLLIYLPPLRLRPFTSTLRGLRLGSTSFKAASQISFSVVRQAPTKSEMMYLTMIRSWGPYHESLV